jgi:predicted dehydrogenase
MPIRLGIAGVRGLVYMPGLLDMPNDVEVTAFCELNQRLLDEKSNEFHIPNRFRNFEDLCESDIDAVLIATPMQLHAQHTLAALEAGKHVLCEVTAATSMEELFWLKEAVENQDKVYMMCENYCYRPDTVLVKRLIEEGYFGELYYAEAEYIEDIRNWLVYPDGKKSWRQYWQVGKRGAFYPTHSVGPLMKWFENDRIDEICCFGVGPYVDPRFRQEDTNIVMIRLKSGKLLRIRIDVMSPRPNQNSYFMLQGTKGAIEAPRGPSGPSGQQDMYKAYFSDGSARVSRGLKWEDLWNYSRYLPENYRNMPDRAKKLADQGDYNSCGGDYYVVQDFIRTIKGEIKNPVDIYDACEWTAVALLSEISAQNGARPVKMPDFRGNRENMQVKI